MLKEKQLNDDLTTVKTGRSCTALELKSLLDDISAENQIPMSISLDTIKVGGVFNSKELECLIIEHPEHVRDYYRIVVVLGVGQANVATTGTSKQMKKFSISEAAKAQRKGKSLSYKLGHVATSSLFLIGKSKNKLEAEKNYYEIVLEAIGFCLEVE